MRIVQLTTTIMVVKIVFNISDCGIPPHAYNIAECFAGYPECKGYHCVGGTLASEAPIHVDAIITSAREHYIVYRGRFEGG